MHVIQTITFCRGMENPHFSTCKLVRSDQFIDKITIHHRTFCTRTRTHHIQMPLVHVKAPCPTFAGAGARTWFCVRRRCHLRGRVTPHVQEETEKNRREMQASSTAARRGSKLKSLTAWALWPQALNYESLNRAGSFARINSRAWPRASSTHPLCAHLAGSWHWQGFWLEV